MRRGKWERYLQRESRGHYACHYSNQTLWLDGAYDEDTFAEMFKKNGKGLDVPKPLNPRDNPSGHTDPFIAVVRAVCFLSFGPTIGIPIGIEKVTIPLTTAAFT